MGSALETLCGQAVGAGQVDMLGIYIQRSWIICGATALALVPTYVFTTPIVQALHQPATTSVALHQPATISVVAGRYTRWVIPQLFAYAANFPLQKFLQAQSKVWAMTFISGVGLALHAALNYIFVTRLGHGLFGAAMIGNVTWWIIILAQLAYLVSGCFPEAWKGFSMLAFSNIAAFVKLSLASAAMLCLEVWYYTAVLILVGLLKNAQLEVDIMSVCINYQLWAVMVALGLNGAVSVRVSNELGANKPKAARFSVIMAVSTSAAIGAVFLAVFLAWRTELPRVFSDNDEVVSVAIGAGWQTLVAFINIGCYYLVGIPLGFLFGFKLKLGALGIWAGMSIGTLLQTVVLLIICFRTKWKKQAMLAEGRIREWGGSSETLPAVTDGSIDR
ncbi:Protein TRANSPARENT TESTA 12 [Triticum urartu]|uniref:Protein TRANSPARENT TESTA 12 n=1 Tax=Triticum urartu TaxID=4572 RepID=M7Z9P3_TRIUA|nr:Protein TRANSPARENT TESTA 12 [Triticum urartu]